MIKLPGFKMRAEDKLILLCARTQMNPEEKEKLEIILQKDLDWDYIHQKGLANKLMPLLYWNLKSFDNIPSTFLKDLKDNFNQNTQNNLILLGELVKILKLFEKEDINVIPYKGPVLAINTYGNLALRNFSDLDLLVPAKDVDKIRETISSLSYEPELKINPSLEDKFFKYQKEYKFINKQGIHLDIHFRFSSLFLPHSSSWNLYPGNILPEIELSSIRTQTLAPENMLLILCLHNYSHQWAYLSMLVDLAEFIKTQTIEWVKVEKMGRQLGIHKILLLNLNLLRELLDFPTNQIPVQFRENSGQVHELTEEIINKRFFKGEAPENKLLTLFKNNLRFRDTLFLGMMDNIKDAFIPTNYELEKITLPSSLFFLYFFMRPFLLLSRYQL